MLKRPTGLSNSIKVVTKLNIITQVEKCCSLKYTIKFFARKAGCGSSGSKFSGVVEIEAIALAEIGAQQPKD